MEDSLAKNLTIISKKMVIECRKNKERSRRSLKKKNWRKKAWNSKRKIKARICKGSSWKIR